MPSLPTGTHLEADPSLQVRRQGRLLMGGAPLRFIRLSEAGGRLVGTWLEGTPVGPGDGPQKLARRLLDAGMVHPVLPPDPASGGVADTLTLSIVIPVRDDQAGLEATLRHLDPCRPVIVVDDASITPVTLPPSAPALWRVIRRAAAGGPGTARQTALAQVDTPLVAFVDAGVELEASQLTALLRWFEDPTIVAVGPRVASRTGPGPLDRYEAIRSPLDLGAVPSIVGPGRRVTYLPSAALVARTVAVRDTRGFDPALRYGEDVDLVWRLCHRGTIRYDPTVRALHPPRRTITAMARQRAGYGSSAAPLARRHGAQVAPVRLSGWSLACWALVALGRPRSALVLAAGTAVALDRKLAPVLAEGRAASAKLAFRGHWAAGGSLADASVRDWWPVTAAAALAGWRRPVLAAVLWAGMRRYRSSSGPWTGRALDLGLGAVDDLAYGTGVWVGAWRERSPRCLLPRLTSWPGRGAGT